MEEEKKEKGFTVKDKRFFAQEEPRETSNAATDTQPNERGASPSEQSSPSSEPPLPEITFSSFIISLSSSALFHFGDIPDPITNKKQRNLPLAKQTIDILGILKNKTVGNLTKEESQLLDNLLYDLRMRYVNEINSGKS
ncbi:MAG: DUF1844 domain-containing protein [Desulfobacterota bacterium]|nr:DUF1844 domain-containing protein [Thermodesulfobacteriota bacterium]